MGVEGKRGITGRSDDASRRHNLGVITDAGRKKKGRKGRTEEREKGNARALRKGKKGFRGRGKRGSYQGDRNTGGNL